MGPEREQLSIILHKKTRKKLVTDNKELWLRRSTLRKRSDQTQGSKAAFIQLNMIYDTKHQYTADMNIGVPHVAALSISESG